jgi:hypothetical protein
VSRVRARDLRVLPAIALNAGQGADDIDHGAGAVWIANRDGSVTRVPVRGGRVRSWAVGGALVAVAGGSGRIWLANAGLHRPVPARMR